MHIMLVLAYVGPHWVHIGRVLAYVGPHGRA